MKLPASYPLRWLVLLSSLLPLPITVHADPETSPPKESLLPCVARSPSTGLYYDLSAITVTPPEMKDGEKVYKDARDVSWHSKGHDYPANFTINICSPVIEDVKDVLGVDSSRWQNISAYYEMDGAIYSIGYVGTS